ncbi:hypothetical protein [Mameliella sediminis]|uniref:hypothetical protein n=1 Tax=Mameliella sediminis TaxID=2836866 RepID=UPI001C46003A|nr:hypothetical protein [Mameliella sediminis]MBV7394117.1 hypothetical protein [Mameliella sediminis]
MFDVEVFEERAAIMEFDGGMTRFRAETAAAEAQGVTRWQAMQEVRNAQRERNTQRGRDHRSALDGQQRADDLPGMQRGAEKEKGSVPQRDEDAGGGRLALLALQPQRRGVL